MTELIKTDRKLGGSELATSGKEVPVHYTDWPYDEAAPDHKGTKFDSSHDRYEPFYFPPSAGYVIKSWDRSMEGMNMGGQRTPAFSAHPGYGAHGAGGAIPPNVALLFDVELLGAK